MIRFRSSALLAAACAVLFAATLPAQTTWDGGGLGNTTWADPANWDNDTLPAFDGTDSLTVTAPTTGNTSLTLGADRSIGRITFGAGGTPMTLSGNTLRLNSTTTTAGTGTALWNAATADGDPATINSDLLLQNGTAGNYTGFFRENSNSNGGTQFNGAITQGAGENWTVRFSQASSRGAFRLNNATNSISAISNNGTTLTSLVAGSFGGASLTLAGGVTGTSDSEHFEGASAVSNAITVTTTSTWSSSAATRLNGTLTQGSSELRYTGSALTYADYSSVSATTGATSVISSGVNGALALASMSQLSNGTLNIGTNTGTVGILVLSGNGSNGVPTWADFSANRTYNQSGGAGTWRINVASAGGQGGGFAARGADVVIPASGGGLTNATFARNFGLGSTATLNGVRYADHAVNIQTDIAYAGNTTYEIRVAPNSQVVRSETDWSFGGPVHELSGQITGGNIAIVGWSGASAAAGLLRISNATNDLTATAGSAWVIGSTRSTQITPIGGRSVGGGNHKDNSNSVMIFTSDGAFGGATDVVVSAVSSSGSVGSGYLLFEDQAGPSTTFGRNFHVVSTTGAGAGFGAWGGNVIYQGDGVSTGLITLNGTTPNLPLSAENGSTLRLGTNGGDAATVANYRNQTVTYNTGGNGTVILENVVYSGNQSSYNWNIREGTLLANNAVGSATGAGNISASAGATFGGNGSVSGSVTMLGGSILAPGNSPGTLEIGGDLSLASTTEFKLELGGANPGDGAGFYDQVNVLGNANLNGTLTLNTFGGFDPAGGEFYILSRAGGTGNFTGLTEGAEVSINGGLWTGNITYNATWTGLQGTSSLIGGNDVALYNIVGIPEPNVALMIVGGFGLMAMFRRRG